MHPLSPLHLPKKEIFQGYLCSLHIQVVKSNIESHVSPETGPASAAHANRSCKAAVKATWRMLIERDVCQQCPQDTANSPLRCLFWAHHQPPSCGPSRSTLTVSHATNARPRPGDSGGGHVESGAARRFSFSSAFRISGYALWDVHELSLFR